MCMYIHRFRSVDYSTAHSFFTVRTGSWGSYFMCMYIIYIYILYMFLLHSTTQAKTGPSPVTGLRLWHSRCRGTRGWTRPKSRSSRWRWRSPSALQTAASSASRAVSRHNPHRRRLGGPTTEEGGVESRAKRSRINPG